MINSKLPSPSEVESGVDADMLEAGRARLRAALKRHGANFFTYDAKHFPLGAIGTLLAELSSAGWKYQLVRDSRDGDYYEISPN
jgi:hypothetical protein